MIRYLNLTNGLEELADAKLREKDYRFIRIQSTACEQKRWDFVIQDLDNDLLMNLALGRECIIVDSGHVGEPRALWQGVEWIKYVLTRRWFGVVLTPVVRGKSVGEYFDGVWWNLEERTLRKIDYFKRFLVGKHVPLYSFGGRTEHDGDYDYFRQLLIDNGLTANR